jgi:hypothetical protein
MDSKQRIVAVCSGFLERNSKVLLVGTFGAVASLGVIVAFAAPPSQSGMDAQINRHAQAMIDEGRKIFRYDTFGSEGFWGDALQLHKAIAGEKNGGIGPGVSPKTALSVGLKVDADALPDALKKQLAAGKVNLDDPATTIALLKLNAVVGVTAFTNPDGSVKSMGIQCSFCHSTVDDSFAPGIGKRLDGWPNRDLNVGAIVSLAPNLKPFTDLLGVDTDTVKKVLATWGPGRFDAELDKDGKALRPDGKQAGTLIPPAFGLAGVNLPTWTGFGSVPYSNAYVGVGEMHGASAGWILPRWTVRHVARSSESLRHPVQFTTQRYQQEGFDRIPERNLTVGCVAETNGPPIVGLRRYIFGLNLGWRNGLFN